MTIPSVWGTRARAATGRELLEAQSKYRLLMEQSAQPPRKKMVALRFARAEDLATDWPAEASQVVELQVDNCNDVRPLARLVELPDLATLRLGGLGGITTLEWLPALPGLRAMRLEGFGQGLTSLEGIAGVPLLEALVLDPYGGRATVRSLGPLASLTQLRLLALPAISTLDLSLRPIAALQKLELFHGTAYYGPDEYEALAASVQSLRCPWFSDMAWQLL